MVIPAVSPGAPLPATTLNDIVQGVNGIALQGIIPTVDTPASGSATVTSNGKVVFSNTSNVSVNGCFTGAYDNYRIVLNSSTRSVGATLNFRLRQAGTDLQTATYGWLRQQTSGTASQAPTTATAGTASPLDAGQAVGQSMDGFFDIYGPALGTYTAMLGNSLVWANGAPVMFELGMQNSTTQPSDGFSIYLTQTGTFTGVLRVYGYNNLT